MSHGNGQTASTGQRKAPSMTGPEPDRPAEAQRPRRAVTALTRRAAFEQAHPGFRFRPPWDNPSRRWEVDTPHDGTLTFQARDADRMMDTLERKYPA